MESVGGNVFILLKNLNSENLLNDTSAQAEVQFAFSDILGIFIKNALTENIALHNKIADDFNTDTVNPKDVEGNNLPPYYSGLLQTNIIEKSLKKATINENILSNSKKGKQNNFPENITFKNETDQPMQENTNKTYDELIEITEGINKNSENYITNSLPKSKSVNISPEPNIQNYGNLIKGELTLIDKKKSHQITSQSEKLTELEDNKSKSNIKVNILHKTISDEYRIGSEEIVKRMDNLSKRKETVTYNINPTADSLNSSKLSADEEVSHRNNPQNVTIDKNRNVNNNYEGNASNKETVINSFNGEDLTSEVSNKSNKMRVNTLRDDINIFEQRNITTDDMENQEIKYVQNTATESNSIKPKRITIRAEDVNIAMRVDKEKLAISIKAENIVPNNISFLDKNRLVERLHHLGFELEMLNLNGVQIISKSEKPLNYNKRGYKEKESLKDEIVNKKDSYSDSFVPDFNLFL